MATESEEHSMCERILKALNGILRNRFYIIHEFSIIPIERNEMNKSPIYYESNSLALESWCVKYLRRYFIKRIIEPRTLVTKKRVWDNTILEQLTLAVLINPNVPIYWNMKRELFEKTPRHFIYEMNLCRIVLSSKPKSLLAFEYRRWLVEKNLEDSNKDIFHFSEDLVPMLKDELRLNQHAVGSASNNYHAWTYRIWCMDTFSKYLPDETFGIILCGELRFSGEWLQLHVSENAGFHYRQFLLSFIRKERGYSADMFDTYFNDTLELLKLNASIDHETFFRAFISTAELKDKSFEEIVRDANYLALLFYELQRTIEDLNEFFGPHETIWNHRRYVVHAMFMLIYDYLDMKPKQVCVRFDYGNDDGEEGRRNLVLSGDFSSEYEKEKTTKPPYLVETSTLYQTLLKIERKFIKDCVNCRPKYNNKPLQLSFAKRHENWLKCIIGLR